MSAHHPAPGRGEGLLGAMKRRLGAAPATQAEQDIAYLEASGLFDRERYLEMYPDVAQAALDPIRHYVLHGAREGRDPSDSFDTSFYLERNPDVAASGMNPFRHYCEFGRHEQRQASPELVTAPAAAHAGAAADPGAAVRLQASAASLPGGARDDHAVIAESGLFDAEFYLASYPKVAQAGMDPIRHYVRHGVHERLNPSPFFDTRYYLDNNPEVADAGVNPLRHFHEQGWKEFRQPSPEFDAVRYYLMHMAGRCAAVNPLLHYLREGRVNGLPAYRTEEAGPLERNRMVAAAEGLFATADVETLKLLGSALFRINRWSSAEEAFRRVAALEWQVPQNHVALAQCLASQAKWWLVAQSMSTAVGLDEGRSEWFAVLADAHERMNRFEEAATAYRKALKLAPRQPDLHYRLGFALERSGAGEESAAEYAEALRLTTDKDAARYGVGVFHQLRGLWEDARDAYRAEVARQPLDGGLRYRLGTALDRLYDWRAAADCYVAAIALSAGVRMPSWHYRLGFVLERMGRLREAADAYSAAIALSERHVPYWNYRLGFALEAAGMHEMACGAYRNTRQQSELPSYRGFAFPEPAGPGAASEQRAIRPPESYFSQFSGADLVLEALSHDMSIAESHFQLGERRERIGDLPGAAEAYAAAVVRSSDHQPAWYYRLGYVLAAAGKYREACDAFRQTRVLQRPHGVSEDGFRKHPDMQVTTSYVEYRECLPVRDDVIVYESFNGNSLTCSPLALFRALLDHPDYRDHLHVWVLNDPERIPEDLRHRRNVVFVSKGSDGYLRHIATAKYLVNNSGFPPYFVRRPEQKYLATWHGTPLKTLGKEQKYKFYDHKRTQRNYLQATHIITPNPHTTRITLDSYDIRPLYTGLFAETGYPRIDLTVNASEERKRWLRERLGLAGDRPVVLYAPTWRGTLDEVEFDSVRLESDLEALSRQGCQILFRGHSLLERVIKDEHLRCEVVPADIDTNELLAVVDVLITDYSSVFFDFMATGRPILYYIYDVEEYERERGLYFSMEEMPGFKCRNIDELCDALGRAIRDGTPDEAGYAKAQGEYNCHDDGRATERVIGFFFNDDRSLAREYRTSERPAVIMAGGSFTPNGITTSFVNLVNNMDRGMIDVVVAFSPNTVELSQDNIDQFRKLPDDIFAVPRYGNMPMTLEERWLKKLQDAGEKLNETALAIMRRAYSREFVRIFGFKQYHAAVSFAGYDAFWTAILFANDLPLRRVVYLHNDMYSEYTARFPELERMFQLYGMADRLISVSERTNELNRTNLSERYALDPERFDFCDNLSNPEEIIARSGAMLDQPEDESLFDDRGPVFINMARLSVEKDHEKLIRAFARIVGDRPSAKLLILGSGPLEHHLLKVVADLGMEGRVHLLGYRANPYPYLRRADCFVLSSNHEGQPMTLLEALVLDKPIVATDIVGNRSVLHDRPGLLVPNSVEGLVAGMRAFMGGDVPTGGFDWRAYQQDAIDMFNRRVLGLTGRAGA